MRVTANQVRFVGMGKGCAKQGSDAGIRMWKELNGD